MAKQCSAADQEFIDGLPTCDIFTKPYMTANPHLFVDTAWIDVAALRSFLVDRDSDRDHIVISSSSPGVSVPPTRVKRELNTSDMFPDTVKVKSESLADPEMSDHEWINIPTLREFLGNSAPEAGSDVSSTRFMRFSPYPDLIRLKTGTELTLVEALENAYVVDQNTADKIATAFRMGVLTNPHNEVTHRMGRNSQRQSKIAQKARESQERTTERKDLEA
ncbi:hypothetical protein B0H11DRAFT_2069500 [Mycena galericulata]|nr:hypothetical protein B0H11DRAFT_2069500 [Mycena galericulata]